MYVKEELARITEGYMNIRGQAGLEKNKRTCPFIREVRVPTVKRNCSSVREKRLKFEAEGREFSKFVRSLEQFTQAVKGQNNLW